MNSGTEPADGPPSGPPLAPWLKIVVAVLLLGEVARLALSARLGALWRVMEGRSAQSRRDDGVAWNVGGPAGIRTATERFGRRGTFPTGSRGPAR